MNGTVNFEHKLFGTVNSAQHISGTIGQCAAYSDHEVVTIDLYRLNEQVIAPTLTNALFLMTPREITTDLLSSVNYSLTSAEIQTENYTITPIEVNFEEAFNS